MRGKKMKHTKINILIALLAFAMLFTMPPLRGGHAYADTSQDLVKITFVGSSIDGESIFKPYVISVPRGSSTEDVLLGYQDDISYQDAIKKHFQNDAYKYYGSLQFMSKPLNSFDTWDDVMTESMSLFERTYTEDTTLYVAIAKYIDTIAFSVERPVCGVEVKNGHDEDYHFYQENAPVITTKANSQLTIAHTQMNPQWIESDTVYLFVGTINGGESYRAAADLDRTVKFGYILDSAKLPSLTVDNADEGSIVYPSRNVYNLTFNVTARHDCKDSEVTKEATCTEKGIKEGTCSVCGQIVTEEIPALGHKWDAGVVTRKPTATSQGVRTYTCKTCGETKTEAISNAAEKEAAKKAAAKKAASNINKSTVTAADIKKASNLGATTVTLGAKVKKISKNAFKGTKIKTVIVKTKKLKKASVKKALTGSKVTRIKVSIGKKKVNKTYVKKYKKIFTKKNAGKKVKVSL